MPRTIVTAGKNAADIDVLACSVSYAELLRREGKEAQAVIPGVFIMNVTPTVLSWESDFVRIYRDAQPDDAFVLVDFSNIEHVARFVDPARIIEVYDHRRGFEEYWQEKLGEHATIELVGACATLIWEQWKERGRAEEVRETCARLLATAILSNTLVFKANNTHARDRSAYHELLEVARLPEDWTRLYFDEQRQTLLANLEELVRTDTKIEKLRSGKKIAICQIELWSGRDFLFENRDRLRDIVASAGPAEWFVTIPSIEEEKNYLFTTQDETKKRLQRALGAAFIGDTAETDKLLMRKEITAILQDTGA